MQSKQEPSNTDNPPNTDSPREYERSGCYPEDGKPFRIWALLGWLTALIVLLAGVAALLNLIFLDVPA